MNFTKDHLFSIMEIKSTANRKMSEDFKISLVLMMIAIKNML